MDDMIQCDDLYDVVRELRGLDEPEMIFPRQVKGLELPDYPGDEDDVWFHPIKMSREFFDSLTDREVVQYIYSQDMGAH